MHIYLYLLIQLLPALTFIFPFKLARNHQEPFTGASRGIAGEMINACGGRFHIIRDSEPAQRAALVAQIHKLLWLNSDRFYSALNQTQQLEAERMELLQRLKEIDGKLGESQVSSAMRDTLGVVGWSLLVSLIAVVLATEEKHTMLIFEASLAGLVTFMVSLRNALSPHVAFALNLALCSTVVAAFIKYLFKSIKEERTVKRSEQSLYLQ